MGLGTDVAGGYSLSMLSEMKEAIENSKYLTLFSNGKAGSPMTVTEAFYLATLGGARVLSMEKSIGSLEAGKQADFLVIDHSKADPMGAKSLYTKPEQILSKLIYRGTADMIEQVFVRGKQLK
jgi:guanine deaminase